MFSVRRVGGLTALASPYIHLCHSGTGSAFSAGYRPTFSFTRFQTDMEEKECLQGILTIIYNCYPCALCTHLLAWGYGNPAQSFCNGSVP